jgi:phage protein D
VNSAEIWAAVKAGASSPQAVSEAFIDSLDTVTVRQAHDGPSTCQLLLDAERTPGTTSEFPLIAAATVAPGNRLKVGVEFRGTAQGLFDGVVAHQELNYEAESGVFTYSVIGEDVSAYMRLEAKAAEWPGRSSAQIAREIISNYSQYVTPTVVAPPNDYTPAADQWVRQQNSTDLSFLRALGRPFGYVFATRAGATIDAQSVAYWGPPPRDGTPLPALTVEMGAETNVVSIAFEYDAAAATVYAGGSRVDENTFAASKIASSADFGLKAFATSGSLSSALKRTRRFVEPNLAGTLAGAYADALAQVSARGALRATVVVDALDYGAVVTPASVVPVRGAGKTHDGLYYVESVEHTMKRGSYQQEIVMTREGLGSTITTAE